MKLKLIGKMKIVSQKSIPWQMWESQPYHEIEIDYGQNDNRKSKINIMVKVGIPTIP